MSVKVLLDVFRTLPRTTERRCADREHTVRTRLGTERRRPEGSGFVFGVLIGAGMWSGIIALIFALTGCATVASRPTETFSTRHCPAPLTAAGCTSWLDDVNQRVWDQTSPVSR